MCVCSCKPVYETSLTDRQWAVIEPLLPVRDPRHGGRPLKFDRRLILDTILYVLRTGCAWRLVPHDLAPWDAAYRWFRAWRPMAPGDRCTTCCASGCARPTGVTPSPPPRSWTPSQPRAPKAAKRSATTRANGSAAANDICW